MIADKDKNKIKHLALKYGVKRVLLFGSRIRKGHSANNIDIAVEGVAHVDYFRFYGELLCALSKPVDIVDLDSSSKFTELIKSEGVQIFDGLQRPEILLS